MANRDDLNADVPLVCVTCIHAIVKRAESAYARSLPMCAACEEQALRDVRPSPRNRKQSPERTR